MFQENPGRTAMVVHDIVLKDNPPVFTRCLSYRIPERLLVAMKKEVDLMLTMGIIELSRSEWYNPMVLVPDFTMKSGSVLTFVI